MAIRIKRNEAGNCIEFQGSSNPVYWNACLSGEVDSSDTTKVNVINDIKTAQSGTTQYEFFRIPFSDFADEDGASFSSAQEVADYVTLKGNVSAPEDINVGYKGVFDASTNLDPTDASPVNGDWYYIGTEGTIGGVLYKVNDIIKYSETSTSWEKIENKNATVTELQNSALDQYNIHVDADYTGTIRNGTALHPYNDLLTAINASSANDSILVKGINIITSEIVLPHSLSFYGANGAEIKFANYDATNGDIFSFEGDMTQKFVFKDITFKNAGGYGLLIKKTDTVEIRSCKFYNNGWNGTGLHTVLDSATSGVLGYDSTNTELQSFYASANASNGGAVRLQECTKPLIRESRAENNLRGFRVQDCGINGGGFVIENQSLNNIESGIYLAAGSLGGCQNITVTINYSSYNANNGLLCIGGINNKFSQNEVNGNWNAGLCAWGSTNLTLRDSGLYDNNRSQYNGIGNTGDAKASIQINDAYSFIATQITYNPATRFIAEILDTQVHYTGLGSNSEKIGFLMTSGMGLIPDNPKNIIKIDDVGFIGQDYAIDLSEVDVTNLRLSLGDNSYQSISQKAVKAPLNGNYSELPFSNHVMQVPEVDVVVDTLKQTIALHEGVGGNVINVYKINELQSLDMITHVDIIQKSSDKIQLRGLTLGNIYVNGSSVGTNVSSMNDSLNAAFEMSLIEYKEFLTSDVGINEGTGSGGSLPAIANNWYVSYGSQAGTQVNSATIGNSFRNYNPFYNGEALEKGHEFIWTLNATVDFMIGVWGAAEGTYSGSDAIQASNWSQGFFLNGNAGGQPTSWSQSQSSGVTITANGSVSGEYAMPNGQAALRFGQDGYLYLFEIVGGGYTLIGKSNSTVAGTSVMIQFGAYNQASFPVMTERTETWEIVHDFDNSENSEWSDGIEDGTILKSRMTLSTGQKITMSLNHFGRGEHIGFGYLGASSGVANAENQIDDHFFYNQSELLKGDANNGGSWTFNDEATGYYDPIGDGSNIGYWNGNGVNLGEIAIRYTDGNAIKLFHETNNELIATLNSTKDGSPINIYFGAAENNHPANRIPVLSKFDLADNDNPTSGISEWWYIESPDGVFYYPLFKTESEANAVDVIEGGTGTSHTHTFLDDPTNTTWYMNTTNSTHVGTAAPQSGVYGNSTNVIWNEQETGVDSSSAPTFNDIVYTIQEGSAVNIQYKPQGDTNIYNVTNVPAGYADSGFSIIGTAETILDGIDIEHVINVTKANDYGSDTGVITFTVTDDPTNNASANDTPWTKALDFSGGEYLRLISGHNSNSVLKMSGMGIAAGAPVTAGNTSNDYYARPWATSIVFKVDGNNSNQYIWNSGEGTSSSQDNIYLRVDANNDLYFGWGRNGVSSVPDRNECKIASAISTSDWYGVYVASTGERLSAGDATAANLADCFDIRLMSSSDAFASVGSNLSTSTNWVETGSSMTNTVVGIFTIGSQSGSRTFYGKVASMVVTTLKNNQVMPTDAEIKAIITDPKSWVADYKLGQTAMSSAGSGGSTFLFPSAVPTSNNYTAVRSTQVWLMGDGTNDSFSNGVRSYILPTDTGNVKLYTNNMTASDIENVSINGLS